MKPASRLTHWLLGFAFGGIAGGFMLEAGVLALLLIAPVLVWTSREIHRPLGLAGLIAGIGFGWVALLGLADQECRVDSSCSMPDQTGYFIAAGVLILVGVLASILAQWTRATKSE